MDVGVQGGGGNGETSHKKWLDLEINLLDQYKLTAWWINPIGCCQPLYLCAMVCLGHMPFLLLYDWMSSRSDKPRRETWMHGGIISGDSRGKGTFLRWDSIVESWKLRVRCSKSKLSYALLNWIQSRTFPLVPTFCRSNLTMTVPPDHATQHTASTITNLSIPQSSDVE